MQASDHNAAAFARARQYIPGGVNSPVRAFKAVGREPLFIAKADGCRLYDINGRDYIDYIGSWGPMIAGHNHPAVRDAVIAAAQRGLSYGAPTPVETEMASMLCRLVPSMDRVRMVNSGTEACMSALRLARGATGRNLLIKFAGCYHGHADSFLVKAGSGALTFGQPDSPGVPRALADLTITLPFNDPAAVEAAFAEHGANIGAVIVEPIAGNMNMVLPSAHFLQALREQCSRHGSVLIFDEVMTGFRVSLGGAQALYDIEPDLSTFGKVIGGGMPVGAFGGKQEIMSQLAPEGPIYQAGTLSGNPVAMASGLAMLTLIQAPGFFDELGAKANQLVVGLSQAAAKHGVPFCAHSRGGMFGLFFADTAPQNVDDVSAGDLGAFNRFFGLMLDAGIYLAPSAYEAGFISAAHDEEAIKQTLEAAAAAFAKL